MNNNKMILNATLSIVQVVVMGLSYFIVYKMVLDKLGSELLGVWTLVFSISSVANIANLGVANSLVKFIAVYHKEYDWKKINKLIGTGFYIVAGLMGFVVMLLYVCRSYVLQFLLKDSNSIIGMSILPLSLLSLWINTIGSIFLAVLDGFRETYIKNILYIISAFIFIICTFLFVPNYGILGLGYAQILQGIVVFIGALVMVFRFSKEISLYEMNYNKLAFKEIFSYSFKLQIVTTLSIIMDSVAKFYLVRFGTLSEVGYFEMANRLVIQIRQLLVSANQVIIPFIAQKEGVNDYIKLFYKKNFTIISISSVFIMGALIITAPLVSILWIGKTEPFFITCVVILSFSYIVNLHTLPANFINLGTGNINDLIYTMLAQALGNVLFSGLLGFNIGSIGVLLGLSVAIISGSILQLYLFRIEYRIPFLELYDRFLFKTIVILLPSMLLLYYRDNIFSTINIFIFTLITIFVLCGCLFLVIRKHQIFLEAKKTILGKLN